MTRIAFIGLGNMGTPMAGHLRAAGHEVAVHDRDPAKAEALAGQGARIASGSRMPCAMPRS